MLNEVEPIRAKAPMIHDPQPTWKDDASCVSVGVDPFFPEDDTSSTSIEVVRSVCRECPVAVECRISGMMEEYGIWGGLTASDRSRIRRRVPEWRAYDRQKGTADTYEAKRLRKLVRTATDTAEIVNGLPKSVRTQPFVLNMKVTYWTDGF